MKKKRIPKGTPNLIDKYVGSRVRARRVGLRLSQTNLGQAIGVTFPADSEGRERIQPRWSQ